MQLRKTQRERRIYKENGFQSRSNKFSNLMFKFIFLKREIEKTCQNKSDVFKPFN